MSRPDLTDAEALAAYRKELRGVARWPRTVGLLCVFASLGLWAWPRSGGPWMLGPLPTQTWGWISLAIGWAILLWAIVTRMRYHRARMDEPEA